VSISQKFTLKNNRKVAQQNTKIHFHVSALQQWHDYRLAWNTSEYHGIDLIRVPYNTVWLPDIVLENK